MLEQPDPPKPAAAPPKTLLASNGKFCQPLHSLSRCHQFVADLLERSAQKDSECALLGGLGTACFVLYQHISVRQELPYMTALNVALQLNAATATMLTRQPVLNSLDRHPKLEVGSCHTLPLRHALAHRMNCKSVSLISTTKCNSQKHSAMLAEDTRRYRQMTSGQPQPKVCILFVHHWWL